MDFVEDVLKAQGENSLLVVVDCLSKYEYFIPLTHTFTTAKVAEIVILEIYHLQSMPKTIVSDCDPVFMSNLWTSFFVAQGTKLCHSLA